MRSHSFGSDRLVTGLPLSMRYAFLALRRGMLRVGCNSSRISSMSAIEWRGKRLLLVGACRPILQILTLFQTKKVSLCKILGVLADNLYYDGALVHEPILFLKPLIVFKPKRPSIHTKSVKLLIRFQKYSCGQSLSWQVQILSVPWPRHQTASPY